MGRRRSSSINSLPNGCYRQGLMTWLNEVRCFIQVSHMGARSQAFEPSSTVFQMHWQCVKWNSNIPNWRPYHIRVLYVKTWSTVHNLSLWSVCSLCHNGHNSWCWTGLTLGARNSSGSANMSCRDTCCCCCCCFPRCIERNLDQKQRSAVRAQISRPMLVLQVTAYPAIK